MRFSGWLRFLYHTVYQSMSLDGTPFPSVFLGAGLQFSKNLQVLNGTHHGVFLGVGGLAFSAIPCLVRHCAIVSIVLRSNPTVQLPRV